MYCTCMFCFVLLQYALDHQRDGGFHYNQTEREIPHVSLQLIFLKILVELHVEN